MMFVGWILFGVTVFLISMNTAILVTLKFISIYIKLRNYFDPNYKKSRDFYNNTEKIEQTSNGVSVAISCEIINVSKKNPL